MVRALFVLNALLALPFGVVALACLYAFPNRTCDGQDVLTGERLALRLSPRRHWPADPARARAGAADRRPDR